MDPVFKVVGLGVATVFVLGLFAAGIHVVGAGDQAVIYDYGSGQVTGPTGTGFHLPMFQTAHIYDVKSQVHPTPAGAASKDLQDVHTEVVVRFRLEAHALPTLHRTVGPEYGVRIIAPAVQEAVKAAVARYDADELIENRPAVKDAITSALRTRLVTDSIILEDISITDFDFSEQFNLAIEAKVTQQQRALEELNRLAQIQYQAQQRIVQAEAEANATRLGADAQAYATLRGAEAQAEAARIINEQLQSSDSYLEYVLLQRWDGVLPQTLAGPGNGLNLLLPAR